MLRWEKDNDSTWYGARKGRVIKVRACEESNVIKKKDENSSQMKISW